MRAVDDFAGGDPSPVWAVFTIFGGPPAYDAFRGGRAHPLVGDSEPVRLVQQRARYADKIESELDATPKYAAERAPAAERWMSLRRIVSENDALLENHARQVLREGRILTSAVAEARRQLEWYTAQLGDVAKHPEHEADRAGNKIEPTFGGRPKDGERIRDVKVSERQQSVIDMLTTHEPLLRALEREKLADVDEAARQLAARIRGGFSGSLLAEYLSLRKKDLLSDLKQLEKHGHVQNVGTASRPKWRIAIGSRKSP